LLAEALVGCLLLAAFALLVYFLLDMLRDD
jgi:hypothetical protein